MIASYIAMGVTCLTAILVFYRRVHVYLHYFQQEEYQNGRFAGWVFRHFYFDRKASPVFALQFLAILLFCSIPWLALYFYLFAPLAALVGITAWVFSEDDPRRSPNVKKKLVVTMRVKRIRAVAWVLFGIILLAGLAVLLRLFGDQPRESVLAATVLAILLTQLTPFFVIGSNLLLSIQEGKVQRYYLNEAKQLIRKYAPFTVGITGSYGKTSTKMVLHDMLTQTLGPAFTPVASINTPMGITAYIRKNLRAYHKYAVIEMGAYGIGSIKRLVDLTPPNAGIVTRVGLAHLERYGSQENIFIAKSELPQGVAPDGILVCNGDDPYCRRMAVENPKAITLLYGYDNSKGDLDAWISDLSYDARGAHFRIHYKGQSLEAFCRILGKPLLSNILAAFTMACAMGADPEHVVAVIRTLEPYSNRLQLVESDGFVELHDAYNSNPDGFRAAVDVLHGLEGKRKILVTPGMIELGDREYLENRGVAEYCADKCDLVYIVGETNKKAFLDGLAAKGYPEDRVILVAEMKLALAQVRQGREAGDVLLIENDLPDIYEKLIKI